MEKCQHCPLKDNIHTCIVQKYGSTNLCDKMDPASAAYKPAWTQIIIDKSMGVPVTTAVYSPVIHPSSTDESSPSLWSMAKSAAGAAYNFVAKDHGRTTPDEVYNERIRICESCDKYDGGSGRCQMCGCFVNLKAKIPSEVCPLNKWLPLITTGKRCGSCGAK